MKGKKKLVNIIASVGTLVVLLCVLAGTMYLHSGAKAAQPTITPHRVNVKPITRDAGSVTGSGLVLFGCQSNTNPVPVKCYGPGQIRQAYGVQQLLNKHINGHGSSITIIDAFGSPTIASDLAAFDAQWGLSNPTLNVIAPFGIGGSDFNWAVETTLDVEWSHVMAPGAVINLVIASTNNDVDILAATKYAVDHNIGDVISQSFGENESCVDPLLLAQEHQMFQEAAQKNISVFASSGDNGSAQLDCAGVNLVEAVSSPASDPLVTAVGGTALTADAKSGKYFGETAWNESGSFGAATGGGFSVLYSRPGYQSGATGNHSGRGVPDVALNASIDGGVLVLITDGFPVANYIVGGTSVSSPEFAGVVADGVQIAGHRLGFLNKGIYALGKSNSYGNAFNDITSGDNILLLSGIPGFTATKKWDATTGWGTPKNAGNMLSALIDKLT